MFFMQSKDCTYGILVDLPVHSSGWPPRQSLSISAEPMKLMAHGSEFLDPLPSCLLRKISDDMVDGLQNQHTFLFFNEDLIK